MIIILYSIFYANITLHSSAAGFAGASTKNEADAEHGLCGFTWMGKSRSTIFAFNYLQAGVRGWGAGKERGGLKVLSQYIWVGAGSLPAGLRQWRRAEGRGLDLIEGAGGLQNKNFWG